MLGNEWHIAGGKLARALLPRRLILHPDYFLVRNLNAKLEAGDQADCVPVLRERMRRVLIEAVGHVPHYRRGRISLDACRNEDPFALLGEFPYLTKDEVTRDPDSFVSERGSALLRYRKTSNGTSGQSVVMWRTKQLADIEKAFLDHHWSRWGWSAERSRILRIGMDSIRRFDEPAFQRLRNRLMVSPFHLTDRWLPSIYEEAVRFAPEFFYAYPSCAVDLARFIERSGRPPLKMKALVLTSEPLLQGDIGVLQTAFGAPISVTYGQTERTNFAEATVLPGQSALTYRLNPLYAWQENYVHADGRHEIVGTSYWNPVMPLIRYRTGDFGRIAEGVIERLEGRDLDYLVTKEGAKINGIAVAVELEQKGWAVLHQVQLYQPRPGHVVVRVVPRTGIAEDDVTRILQPLKRAWAGYFDMSHAIVGEIPKTKAGKTKWVSKDLAAL